MHQRRALSKAVVCLVVVVAMGLAFIPGLVPVRAEALGKWTQGPGYPQSTLSGNGVVVLEPNVVSTISTSPATQSVSAQSGSAQATSSLSTSSQQVLSPGTTIPLYVLALLAAGVAAVVIAVSFLALGHRRA